MGDPDDEDYEGLVFDRVDDAILTLADSVSVLASQLFASRRTWVIGERMDALHDPLAKPFLRDRLDLADCRWLDLDAISCHCASAT